jgi:ribonuclease Z
MSVRELVMLGTGADVPTKRRNLHGLLIRWDDEGILVDPAEGTQRQMIFADVTATSLTRVFISQFAADHCLGLAGICQRISLDRVPHGIEVAFPASGRVYYDRLRKASVYHAAARLEPVPLDTPGAFADLADRKLLAAPVHGIGAQDDEVWGFRLQERDRRTMLPDALRESGVVGPTIKVLQREGQVEVDGRVVRLEDVSVPRPGQAVAYLPPCRPSDAAVELARGAAVLVCRNVRLESERADAERRGEMTALEAALIASDAGVGQLVLTGFLPHVDDPSAHREEAAAQFERVSVAEDGDRVAVPRPRKPGA